MKDDTREYTERDLDETIEETFPASDAPANTVETGIVPREIEVPPDSAVDDNRERSRFELVVDGQTSVLDYVRGPLGLTLVHTEVPENQRHRGLGTRLVKAAIASGRREGLRIIAQCAFAKAYLRRSGIISRDHGEGTPRQP
jgi:predicted GNAT family acetyltransferase